MASGNSDHDSIVEHEIERDRTTVTAHPGYPELATRYLSQITDTKLILAGDLIEATSDTGAYVLLSDVLKRTSAKLIASQQAITASPLAAATAAMIGLFAEKGGANWDDRARLKGARHTCNRKSSRFTRCFERSTTRAEEPLPGNDAAPACLVNEPDDIA